MDVDHPATIAIAAQPKPAPPKHDCTVNVPISQIELGISREAILDLAEELSPAMGDEIRAMDMSCRTLLQNSTDVLPLEVIRDVHAKAIHLATVELKRYATRKAWKAAQKAMSPGKKPAERLAYATEC